MEKRLLKRRPMCHKKLINRGGINFFDRVSLLLTDLDRDDAAS